MSIDITKVSLFLYTITLLKILQELDWDSIKRIAYLLLIAFIHLGLYVLLNAFPMAASKPVIRKHLKTGQVSRNHLL